VRTRLDNERAAVGETPFVASNRLLDQLGC
jgi:hypothetical protein